MALLVQNNLVGSAFALLRTIFETCLVGLWVTYLANKDELEQFESGRISLEPLRILKRLRSKDDGDLIDQLERCHTRLKDSLNSYVHGGHEAVAGRFSSSHIGPNYDDERVASFLTIADGMLIVAAMEISTLVENSSMQASINDAISRHVAGEA